MSTFRVVEGQSAHCPPHLLGQMFGIRTQVFRDELEWVPREGPLDIDRYDYLNPTYVLQTDAAGDLVLASGRLMPTTGPTLLSEVFADTIPDIDLMHPSVWEVTRFCSDARLTALHGGRYQKMRQVRAMFATAYEWALSKGIDTFVANYDDSRGRLWRAAGLHFETIGSSDKFSVPVHRGITPVTEEALSKLRAKLG